MIFLTVYAEKGRRSTWDKTPTQHAYRGEEDWARYSRIVEGYMAQDRPHLASGPLVMAGHTRGSDAPDGYIRIRA